MVIAILDAGFEGADEHPAFDNMRHEERLLGTRNFFNKDLSVYGQSSHGTSCLSTMAAFEPNVFVGTAPKASYYLLCFVDENTESILEKYNWVTGAEYADSLGVDVISTSWGFTSFEIYEWSHPFEHYDGHTVPMSIGAGIACSRGMICFQSAGNLGPDALPSLEIPADVEEVFTVGAVNSNGVRADFSSVGPTADGRIKPDLMAMGVETAVAGSVGDYFNHSGTSFSCPILAGLAACFWQANPDATQQQIRNAILETADHASHPDNFYGYGIPDFEAALTLLKVSDLPSNQTDLISIYPNPSKGNVKVVLKEGSNSEINVFDFSGRNLFNYRFNGLNNSVLENYLNELCAGVYFISLTSDSGHQMLKFVKVK
jgi:Subtilisin-like serine proteases